MRNSRFLMASMVGVFVASASDSQQTSGDCSPVVSGSTDITVTVDCNPEAQILLSRPISVTSFQDTNRISVSEARSLLDQPIIFWEHPEEYISARFLNPGLPEEIEVADSCRDINRLSAMGLYPDTNWDALFATRLHLHCQTLAALILSEEPDFNFVRPIASGSWFLDSLPSSLLEFTLFEGVPSSSTIGGMQSERIEILPSTEMNDICFSIDSYAGMCLTSLFTADVNQDGYADHVARFSSFAVGGTYSDRFLIGLTRFEDGATYIDLGLVP